MGRDHGVRSNLGSVSVSKALRSLAQAGAGPFFLVPLPIRKFSQALAAAPPRSRGMRVSPYTWLSVAAGLGLSIATVQWLPNWNGKAPSPSSATEPGNAPPVLVDVVPVAIDSMSETLTAVGTLEANEAIMLRPEIPGVVRRVLFEEGQAVEAGRLLLELDDKELRAQLAQARAQEKIARLTYDRLRRLNHSGTTFVPPQQLDEARSELQSAEANTVLYAARLEKTQIRAPFAAQVGLRRISPGDYVQAGQDLVNLEDLATLKIDFKVPEAFLSRLFVGQRIEIMTEAYPLERFSGEVYAMDPRADVTNRAIRIRARVSNQELKLRPGLFANVLLVLSQNEQAVFVPEEALIPQREKNLVYRVVDGTARLTEITLGQRQHGRVQVIAGLQAGDTVVRAGHHKLKNGAPVVPKQ